MRVAVFWYRTTKFSSIQTSKNVKKQLLKPSVWMWLVWIVPETEQTQNMRLKKSSYDEMMAQF